MIVEYFSFMEKKTWSFVDILQNWKIILGQQVFK